jgi:hypothetical protein
MFYWITPRVSPLIISLPPPKRGAWDEHPFGLGRINEAVGGMYDQEANGPDERRVTAEETGGGRSMYGKVYGQQRVGEVGNGSRVRELLRTTDGVGLDNCPGWGRGWLFLHR